MLSLPHVQDDWCETVLGPFFTMCRLLGLSVYSNTPSKWAGTLMPSWSSWLQSRWPGDHFILSKHKNVKSARQTADGSVSDVPVNDRCLPEPAANIIALCVLLRRWSYSCRSQGGMKSNLKREACQQVFAVRCFSEARLLSTCCSQGSYTCR